MVTSLDQEEGVSGMLAPRLPRLSVALAGPPIMCAHLKRVSVTARQGRAGQGGGRQPRKALNVPKDLVWHSRRPLGTWSPANHHPAWRPLRPDCHRTTGTPTANLLALTRPLGKSRKLDTVTVTEVESDGFYPYFKATGPYAQKPNS